MSDQVEVTKLDYFGDAPERCADVIDQAGVLEQQDRDHGIKAARLATAPQTHPRFDGTHCVEDDCGVVIPAARLALGKVRCVSCQADLDIRKTHYWKG